MSSRDDDDLPAADPQIREVRSRRDRASYLSLAHAVYVGSPGPTLDYFRLLESSLRKRSRLAARAELLPLVAFEGARPVAGLTAMLDERSTRAAGANAPRIGAIGFLEALRGREQAVDLLFHEAERWLASRGAMEIRGPLNGLPHFGSGCLDNRHGEPPVIGMPHNPPWYSGLWWRRGYSHGPSRYAYRIDLGAEAVRGAVERMVPRSPQVSLHAASQPRWREELESYAVLRSECAGDDTDAMALAGDEVWEMLGCAARFADADLLWTAELKGRPVGFALATLDRREEPPFRRLRSRFGFGAPVRRAVLWDVGVLEALRRQGVGSALLARLIRRLIERGVTDLEIHPVAEGDVATQRLLRRFAAGQTKTFLCFVKRPR